MGKGDKQIRFVVEIEEGGRYDVRIAYTAHSNRASNVPVTVETGEVRKTTRIDQQIEPNIDKLFVSIGQVDVPAGGEVAVTISNKETDGHVIVDGVQFLLVE